LKKAFNITVIFLLFLVVDLLALAFLIGYRINMTDSYPLGIYQLTDDAVKKGELILYCPPDTELFHDAQERGYFSYGLCNGFLSPLAKKLVAIPGDHVRSSDEGIYINEVLQTNSHALTLDSVGRALQPVSINDVLTNNTIFILSDFNPGSFDSRYFGAVPYDGIQGVIRPVWTWKE